VLWLGVATSLGLFNRTAGSGLMPGALQALSELSFHDLLAGRGARFEIPPGLFEQEAPLSLLPRVARFAVTVSEDLGVVPGSVSASPL
jgi:hypothetical protein